jgi:hypothetical protein
LDRHLSTGVATIVALMAAHRVAPGRDGAPVACCQEEVDRIDAYLYDKTPKRPVAVWKPAAPDAAPAVAGG